MEAKLFIKEVILGESLSSVKRLSLSTHMEVCFFFRNKLSLLLLLFMDLLLILPNS